MINTHVHTEHHPLGRMQGNQIITLETGNVSNVGNIGKNVAFILPFLYERPLSTVDRGPCETTPQKHRNVSRKRGKKAT